MERPLVTAGSVVLFAGGLIGLLLVAYHPSTSMLIPIGVKSSGVERGNGKEDGTIEYKASARIITPTMASKKQHFETRLTLSLDDVVVKAASNAESKSVKNGQVITPSNVTLHLTDFNNWRGVLVHLSANGTAVDPPQQLLSLKREAVWQVPTADDDAVDLVVYFDADASEVEADPVHVKVPLRSSAINKLQVAGSSLATIVGMIGSLPGILTYWRDRKKRAQAKLSRPRGGRAA